MKILNSKLLLLSVSMTYLFFSCKTTNEKPKEATTTKEVVTEVPITIEKLTNSPAYTDAALVLKNPENTTIAEAKEIDFEFSVENYELGAQTDSPNNKVLANSGKGQHIHFILDNQPYSAHYTPNFKKEIPEGVHHLVAFLSRSYHESVKNERSVVVKELAIGENPKNEKGFNIEDPTLIYSRPKGTYAGDATKSILLDFFVLNTELATEGNKVKATINGKEFTISEWAPQVIKGLPLGEVSIQLELIDKEGTLIPGPFNKVKRTITLTE